MTTKMLQCYVQIYNVDNNKNSNNTIMMYICYNMINHISIRPFLSLTAYDLLLIIEQRRMN